EICNAIRASHDPMALPVLILTAHGLKEIAVEALAAGANDYVTKPFDIAELMARVSNLVRIRRLHDERARRARQLGLAADVGATLTKELRITETAEACVRAIALHLDALAAEVWTKAPELRCTARQSSPDCSVPEEVVRAVAESRVALVTDAVADDPSLVACRRASAFAALPLVVDEESVGVVAFATPSPLENDASSLTTLADLMALGFARMRFDVERSTLLERERNARADAVAANRSKDEFLATVSHELRTPLSAITGWTTMLLTGTLDEARTKRALETIERNARAQVQLIEDLLDISRITSGVLRLELGTVDIVSVAELALESVRPTADAKGVRLESCIEPNVGTLSGDTGRIQQIVWNLLNNAIKFTSKGGRVTLTLAQRGDDVRVSVEDSGEGISPEFLPHVFGRFKQADTSATRTKSGLGLGLAIVHRLVELHGGTVEAFSEGVGRGAKFVASFPVGDRRRASDIRTIAAPPALERPREIEGLRVLVVDDEQDARDFVRALLESCNVQVATVGCAADAFETVRTSPPDILL
ncbi:MAG TPA: ATP-binding protein, partial [Labilithrix sp.]|nr:ATP-binding protein [Labilithrix sp.]